METITKKINCCDNCNFLKLNDDETYYCDLIFESLTLLQICTKEDKSNISSEELEQNEPPQRCPLRNNNILFVFEPTSKLDL